MKTTKLLLTLLMFVSSFSLWAQNEWDDVTITQLNRESSCAVAIPFASADQVANNRVEQSPYYQSLNGTWKFHWAKDPDAKPNDFYSSTYDVSTWDNIEVPSSWQVYGVRNDKKWDKPLYSNFTYPFSYDSNYSVMANRPSDWTYNSNMKNPVGSYRRDFTIPSEWDGRDVYVRFNSAGHGYYLWINGQQVGYSEDSYLPSEFNITQYLKSGTNTIAVQVYRFTSGSFLECQDFWRLSGIHRDVFLWSAPKTQIRDYFFQTDLDDDYRDAEVKIDVELSGTALTSGKLTAKIMDGATEIAAKDITNPVIGKNTLTFTTISNPKKWNAEEPNLYDLVISLEDGTKTIDIRGGKVGFREVGIAPNGALTINGQRMVFYGVNRHDHSEINGRALTKEEIEMDIKVMKRLNINAVRTSHYPNDPYLYELCDKYGLYVLAEANVECHGNMGLSDVELFKKPMVERSENHVKRFRNHVSIFMWSYGNESGGGSNFESVEKAIKALDKTRLTHYQGNSQWSDVSSTMYASYDYIKNIGVERLNQYNNGQKPRPHIQCENSHAMGNSMGNVREMFDLYETYPSLTGEFIWDWKDQSIKMPVPGKTDEYYWAYGGDFGDKPNDGTFCTNGLIFADYTLSAKSYNTKKIYQPVDFSLKSGTTYQLKSKLAFKTIDDLDFYYSVIEDGNVLGTYPINGVTIPAGGTVEINISALPETLKPDAEYFIRFNAYQKNANWWAEAGYEVANEQIKLRDAQKNMYTVPETGSLTVDEDDNNITISGNAFSVVFSKKDGTLSSYTLNGKQMINTPVALNLFRTPTENDKTKIEGWDNMGIRNMSLIAGAFEVKLSENKNYVDVNISNTYSGSGKNTFGSQMAFKIFNDGVVFVNAFISPNVKNVIIPKMGYRFEMPKEFESLTWYGRGPWESYLDRKEACFEGVYNKTVSEQWERYVLPQETANKEDVRWITLTDSDGLGLMFIAPENMSASATHFRAQDLYTNRNTRVRHPYQVKFCEPTVVCLDAHMRALGNASCGPDVLDKYELRANDTHFNFIIMPIEESLTNEIMAEKARIASPISPSVEMTRASNGRVTLTTSIKGTSIYYRANGGEYKKYSSAFDFSEGGIIDAYSELDGYFPSMVTSVEFEVRVSKSKWRVVSYSSQEGGSETAANAIDDNVNTIWHTKWSDPVATHPHEIVVDMRETYKVKEFTYQARQDGSNGRIKDFTVYFSEDGEKWTIGAVGSFQNTGDPQSVDLRKQMDARYFKLIARSEVNGKEWASAAELGVKVVREEPLAIAEIDSQKNESKDAKLVYNSLTNTIEINSLSIIKDVLVSNVLGQTMFRQNNINQKTFSLSTSNFEKEVHIIVVTNENKKEAFKVSII